MAATTSIEPTKTFEERMKERVRDGIGDLISDEDLSKLIHAGLQAAFFEPRVTLAPRDGYGYRNEAKREEPLIYEMLRDPLKQRVNDAVQQWLDEHKEQIATLVAEYVKIGIGDCVLSSLGARFTAPLTEFHKSLCKAVGIPEHQYVQPPTGPHFG